MQSESDKEKFYITTPIFYPNGELHIGHTYTATICDIFARIARLQGKQTYFLTGADENSLKIQKNADEAKMDVISYLDLQAQNVKLLFEKLDISYDQYIRTTNKQRHHQKGFNCKTKNTIKKMQTQRPQPASQKQNYSQRAH